MSMPFCGVGSARGPPQVIKNDRAANAADQQRQFDRSDHSSSMRDARRRFAGLRIFREKIFELAQPLSE